MIIKNIPTPYSKVIEPILDTIIPNKLNKDIKLPNGDVLSKDESISWLKLIRIDNKVEINKEEVGEEVKSTINNEILMLDKDDNVIGEVKDIETLKTMYYFSSEDISKIERGIKTPHPSLSPPGPWVFSKKII